MEAAQGNCITCYGKGEIVDDFGPARCPDCGGGGKQLDGNTQTEWRLRDIEGGHVGDAHGCEADVRWLAFELRRAREALLHIVSRSQDADESDTLAREVRHVAMEALSLYQKVP
ncbi:MAG TPA: hypothetical protein VIW29_18875 [Polyangiaceae bacterium]